MIQVYVTSFLIGVVIGALVMTVIALHAVIKHTDKEPK